MAQKRREAERQKPSPGSVAIHSNRLSFFDNPTEPVRIDPWSFLGLPSKAPAAQSSPKDEASNDEQEGADAARKVNMNICLIGTFSERLIMFKFLFKRAILSQFLQETLFYFVPKHQCNS